ncbi:hypothetical protein THAOC_10284, partial [Thalassiosira oceanica]
IGLIKYAQDAPIWKELIRCMLDPQRKLPDRPNWESRNSSNTGANTLPTNSWGGIDYTRLDLTNFDLVPIWWADLWPEEYGDDVTRVEANEIARRSILTKYLERQLQADRILTISNFDFCTMRAYSDLAPISMTDDEKRSARARGLTREWDLDWDFDSDTPHFLRDKKGYE